MLSIECLSAGYGSATILKNLDFSLKEGALVTIMGSSGSGKTTLLNTIFRRVDIRAGSIIFDGNDLSNLETWQLNSLGLSLVPEGRMVFPNQSVLENLKLGGLNLIKNEGKKNFLYELDKIYHFFPILRDRFKEKAANLSGGEQQMLAIGRALLSRPKLLCMDEPMLGLSPMAIGVISDTIVKLRDSNISVLLTQQREQIDIECNRLNFILEDGKINCL